MTVRRIAEIFNFMANVSLLNEANPSYCTQVLAAGLLIEANLVLHAGACFRFAD